MDLTNSARKLAPSKERDLLSGGMSQRSQKSQKRQVGGLLKKTLLSSNVSNVGFGSIFVGSGQGGLLGGYLLFGK
jgi:hypothetical protein